MPERSVRFAVADLPSMRRAATWKCWTSGGGKSEIYLACRELRSAIKLSMHESGKWHFAFRDSTLFDEATAPASRFLGKYDRPREIFPGLTLACKVVTLAAATFVELPTLNPKVQWIPKPTKPGNAGLVLIFIQGGAHDPDLWPGKDSHDTRLVGTFVLDNGARVWVVATEVPQPDVSVPIGRGTPHFFKGAGPEDVQGENLRAMAWGIDAAGSIEIVEGRVVRLRQ